MELPLTETEMVLEDGREKNQDLYFGHVKFETALDIGDVKQEVANYSVAKRRGQD